MNIPVSRTWLLFLPLLLLVACSTDPIPTEATIPTAIDALGANPNPSPANVGTHFSWTVLGQNLTCKLDVEGDGTLDYTVQDCSSHSRVTHTYGVQGSFVARLSVTGADGKTVEQTTPVTITSPNIPPAIPTLTPSTPPNSTNPLTVRFAWTVSDLNSDITHCRFDADSDGVWEFDNLCSGLPATSSVGKSSLVTFTYDFTYARLGRYTATLEAADPFSATQATVQVRAPYNRAPKIDGLKTTTGANRSAQLNFTVSDPDGDPLSCILTVQGVGVFHYPDCSTLTRNFAFPADGTYAITLVVSDLYQGSSSQTTQIVVGGAPSATVTSIVPGVSHTCALLSSGVAYCWGDNEFGQLGNPTQLGSYTSRPLLVGGNLHFVQLAVGNLFTCGVTTDNEAYCWGKNEFGQLGNATSLGSNTPNPTPLLVEGSHAFTQVAAGGYHTCGIDTLGDAYCWGKNDYGQLGNSTNSGNSNPNGSPLLVEGSHNFTQLLMGGIHTCGLATDSISYCWGANNYGQLGNSTNSGTDNANTTPLEVTGSHTFTQLTGGWGHNCGLTGIGETYCWGSNYYGQLGSATPNLGSASAHYTPTLVVGSHAFIQLGWGGGHNCGITANGITYCWGQNFYGQLGSATPNLGTGNYYYNPEVVVGSHAFTQVTGNLGHHVCGLTVDNKIYCWGRNNKGQIGTLSNLGSDTANFTPELVTLPQ
jgi:alpha-tubulin suppressor-like RCC1 family protein